MTTLLCLTSGCHPRSIGSAAHLFGNSARVSFHFSHHHPAGRHPEVIAHQVKVAQVAGGNLFGVNPTTKVPRVSLWYGGFINREMADDKSQFRLSDVTTVVAQRLTCEPSDHDVNNSITPYSPLLYLPAALRLSSVVRFVRISSILSLLWGTNL